jgi:heat shock protein HslJ
MGVATNSSVVTSFQAGGLTVGSVGASMMMCDEALMEQGRVVFEVLKQLASFGISEDGGLLLRTNDGRMMTAKRGA